MAPPHAAITSPAAPTTTSLTSAHPRYRRIVSTGRLITGFRSLLVRRIWTLNLVIAMRRRLTYSTDLIADASGFQAARRNVATKSTVGVRWIRLVREHWKRTGGGGAVPFEPSARAFPPRLPFSENFE